MRTKNRIVAHHVVPVSAELMSCNDIRRNAPHTRDWWQILKKPLLNETDSNRRITEGITAFPETA